jgi:dTMP kinase
MSGRFITFEGGEGAGKSTQIERLAWRLEARGATVVRTREPGGSERAERIRGALLAGGAKPLGRLAEALLFSAARQDHLQSKIRPALETGAFVLCDRFADSTRAYQGLDGGLIAGVIASLERIVVDATKPDLTFILDVPAEIGLQRASARRASRKETADRFEAEGIAFHERLRQAFLDIAKEEPERCVVIDARQGADVVQASIWEVVEQRFGGALREHDPLRVANAG